eukprot:scaffold16033_cov55-Cyclotella_meneghiniana.AAC.2
MESNLNSKLSFKISMGKTIDGQAAVVWNWKFLSLHTQSWSDQVQVGISSRGCRALSSIVKSYGKSKKVSLFRLLLLWIPKLCQLPPRFFDPPPPLNFATSQFIATAGIDPYIAWVCSTYMNAPN